MESKLLELENKLVMMGKILKAMEQARITQQQIPPNTIKMRHVGEGVRFIRGGLAADRPTTPELTASGYAIYFAYDTFVLSAWTGGTTGAWKSVTLS